MIRKWLLALPALALAGGCAPGTSAPTPGSRAAGAAAAPPRLVVMVVVDQLRTDLLTRYDRFFTGGLRRLMDQGAYFEGVHDHAWSETGPGHATLSTGVVPARSGIVANDWFERVGDLAVNVYTVQDTLSPIVGVPEEEGRSPLNLVRPGLADWMQDANPAAKVVSIAGKDRSAVLMAGKTRGQVYWYNTARGRFVTSAFYAKEYPEWVQRFNQQVIPTLLDSTWTEQSPVAARALAGADTAAYEANGVNTFFPHRFQDEAQAFGGSFFRWAGTTPMIDRLVREMAQEAVRVNGLGADDVPDFLAVGFAQTDYVGHRFGPLSREQLDNLIRLDRELATLFDYLDRTVGAGRWVAGVSSDHGANTAPEQLAAQGKTAYRLSAADRARLEATARQAAEGVAPDRVSQAVAQALRQLPFIADAYTLDEIARGTPRDSFVTLMRKSHYPNRFPSELSAQYGVEIRPKEGVYIGGAFGTSHVGPYFEDRWVPLFFLGEGIRPMRGTGLVRTVDLAPTLARLAGIRAPRDLDGRVILPTGGAR